MKKKIHLSNLIIYFLCCLSLLLSFYFNEDGSYLPFSGDFRDTWPYVLKLKETSDSQLRIGGLIFAIIGFVIIWYVKK